MEVITHEMALAFFNSRKDEIVSEIKSYHQLEELSEFDDNIEFVGVSKYTHEQESTLLIHVRNSKRKFLYGNLKSEFFREIRKLKIASIWK